ncbi:MAG: hypothetical protein FWC44_03430 [Methanomassiliicoccaceae archaeon]|nr:hypothetical protein [Methanomassiliicoccaceae archaeon]
MRSLKQRVDETSEDPIKLKRVFTAVWVIAYGMLILGFLLIVWVLFTQMS